MHDFIGRAFDDPAVTRIDVYTDSCMGQRPEIGPSASVMLDRSFTPEAGDLADANADPDLIDVDGTTRGGQVTLHFPAADAGRMVDVYMFSAARPLAADVTVDSADGEGRATVTIPADIEPGNHRIAAVFHDDGSLRWDGLTVTAPQPSEPSGDAGVTPA